MSTNGLVIAAGAILVLINGRYWYRKGWFKGRDEACAVLDEWFDKNMRGSAIEDIPDFVQEKLDEGYSEYTPVLVIDPNWVQWNGKVNPVTEEE